MIKILLYLLDKIPYRTRFGLSLADELKIVYYEKIGKYKRPKKCICGGQVWTIGIYPDGWETHCNNCNFIFDED